MVGTLLVVDLLLQPFCGDATNDSPGLLLEAAEVEEGHLKNRPDVTRKEFVESVQKVVDGIIWFNIVAIFEFLGKRLQYGYAVNGTIGFLSHLFIRVVGVPVENFSEIVPGYENAIGGKFEGVDLGEAVREKTGGE